MVAWIGFKQVPMLYDRDERFAGKTKYPLRKMIRLTFDAMTGFSMAPLRLASYLGAWVGLAAIALIAYTLVSWIAGKTVPGWTSLSIIVLMLGSAQLLLIGIIGEYVGRLFMEAKRRPLFIIRDVVTQRRFGSDPDVIPDLGASAPSTGVAPMLPSLAIEQA